jgi:hypothetical protein
MPAFPENIHEGAIPAGKRAGLPVSLRLFCAYLIVMFPAMVLAQAAYLLFHLYRIFTIAALSFRARFSIANAKAYLIVSFLLVVLFGAATGKLEGAGLASIPAVGTTLPWWLYLSKSEKVRAFETDLGV